MESRTGSKEKEEMKPTDKELADLNAEMHKLCGWHYDASRRAWHRNGYWTAEPDHYTSDRAAAMEVLEICATKIAPVAICIEKSENGWACYSEFMTKADDDGATESTLPLTICRFAKQLFSK